MLWTVAGLLVRSGLILGAAELIRRGAKMRDPVNRHRVVLAAFAALLVWPVLAAVLPAIQIAEWVRASPPGTVTIQQTLSLLGKVPPQSRGGGGPIEIWLAGAVLALVPFVIGYSRARMLVRNASVLDDSSWDALVAAECARLKLNKRPKLLIHDGLIVPFTFGLRTPLVVLPAESREWPLARRRAILTHELAHIKRCDLFWQMVAVIATALWWFQPIAWLSRSALRRESERACDASALSSGLRPSEYARELLSIAQRFTQNQASPSAGIAVVRRGELEGRLYAILDEQPGQPGRPPLAAFAALFALTLVSSCLTVLPEVKQFQGGHPMKNTVLSGLLFSAGLSAATIGGSVFDPGGSAVPDAQALLLNADTSVKQEAKTTPDGKFTFEGLSAGSYILHIEKPGFSSLFREFNVQPDSEVRKGLVLSAGSPADPGPVPGSEAKPLDGNPLRVKGTLAQTNLVKKVQPAYPAEAKTQHVQGVVQLEAVISKDGVPEDLRVLSSPSDDLSQSALEAVRQWRYRPTWLNGQPVQIVTDVRINYTLAE